MTGSEVRYHEPNSPEPFAVESERIHNGRAILKVRTSLWDRKWENPYVEYFKGRQVRVGAWHGHQFLPLMPVAVGNELAGMQWRVGFDALHLECRERPLCAVLSSSGMAIDQEEKEDTRVYINASVVRATPNPAVRLVKRSPRDSRVTLHKGQ